MQIVGVLRRGLIFGDCGGFPAKTASPNGAHAEPATRRHPLLGDLGLARETPRRGAMPTALRVVEGDGELDRDPRSQPHLAERGLFCFCDSGVLFADCHPERLADGSNAPASDRTPCQIPWRWAPRENRRGLAAGWDVFRSIAGGRSERLSRGRWDSAQPLRSVVPVCARSRSRGSAPRARCGMPRRRVRSQPRRPRRAGAFG